MQAVTAAPLAITGLGVVTPAGSTPDQLWDTLIAGRSVAGEVQHLDVSEAPIRFACEVADFDPTTAMSTKEARRTDRNSQLTIAACSAAIADAALHDPDGARVATIIGTGFGGLETADRGARDFFGVGPGGTRGRVNPLFVPTAMPNAGSALVAMRHGFRGPCLTVSTACAAGATAIGEAARLLLDGSADVVVAGGGEAPLTPWIMTAFAAAHALSSRTDDPGAASRPFDRDRDGFVIAEGAAALVMERLPDATARGARVYALLRGYARNTDAHHLTAPSPDGRGAADCMRLAIENAGIQVGDVAHVNAHGTSTLHNDNAEAKAIRALFGDAAPPVTSIKGVLGHSIGAAGAIEAVASVLTLERSLIPPTANYTTPDPEIDIDVVSEPRPLPPGVVLSNSFAFGGHNAVLVFSRPD
jgi:3-oxoacyl-[acyl-carrier-protein] synthase II